VDGHRGPGNVTVKKPMPREQFDDRVTISAIALNDLATSPLSPALPKRRDNMKDVR